MQKKIICILVSMLLISTILPIAGTVLAGDEENPEIEDEIEDDVVEYLDIISAWFYEKSDQPDYLFIGLKVKEINDVPLKQKMTVHWEYNGIECSVGVAIGYGEPWFSYSAGWGHGFGFQEHYQQIEGDRDEETGIITFEIPKDFIKNPQKGDVLTNTYALTFQRFGFLGRLGFDRAILSGIILLISGQSRSDFGPNEGYGKEYIIQY